MRGGDVGLTEIVAPAGTLISYATQPDSVASDGSDHDSPYTEALVAALHEPGLNIFQTFNQVGLLVRRSTNGAQEPWLSSSPIHGDFRFADTSHR
jgi:uncharacterized caspase-like protein